MLLATSRPSLAQELIPEFYTLPDFLRNDAQLPLGTMQAGNALGDAHLPPWAASAEGALQRRAAPRLPPSATPPTRAAAPAQALSSCTARRSSRST